MIYSIATWKLENIEPSLPKLITWLGNSGFTGLSFDESKQELLARDASERELILNALDEYNLPVSIHCATIPDAGTVTGLSDYFGERLVNVTMNSAMRHDSRGVAFDDDRICRNLLEILKQTEEALFRVGFEDFPRDQLAADTYFGSLKPLIGNSRYGVLADLGHMNFWLKSRPYYEGISIREYLQNIPVPVLEVHLHDNDGTADQHLPLGKGNINLKQTAEGLKSIGFDGFCTFEFAPGPKDSTSEELITEVLNSLQLWKTASQG